MSGTRALIALALAAGVVLAPDARAWAQGEAVVRGTVEASADGSAISGARVRLVPAGGERSPAGAGGEEIATDAQGRFLFRGVRPGSYELTAARDGFERRVIALAVEPRELRVVTVPLDLAGVAVRVEVSGRGDDRAGTHSPSSTMVDEQQLEAQPAASRTGLPEALLTLVPGLIRGHDDFVHIRGQEMALNPILNGVSFAENPHALLSAGLSPEVIESANVLTGGFPAEYGNRFGGVVDIVTKSGFGMRNSGSLAASGGEAGRRSVSGEYGGHGRRVGYYVYGSVFESDRFLSPPDPEAIHDSGRGGHAFGQVDADLGDAGALRGVVMGDGADFDVPVTPLDVELRPLALASQRTRQQTATLGWTRAAGDAAVGATVYQRWSRSRLLPAAGPLTARADLTRDLLTIGAKADVTRFAGRHAVKAGIDLVRLRPDERLSYDYEGYRALTHVLGLPHFHLHGNPIVFDGREAGGQVSAYVQDAVEIGGRVTADLGVRIDRYDLAVSATHASPRANVTVAVGRGAQLHASYNRFFVPPAIEGILSSSAGLTAAIREIGVALLAVEPTIEDQVEVGGSSGLGPLRVALTGYYRASDNPTHTTVWPDSRIYSYATFDRARAKGLELKATAPGLARYGVTGFLNYALGRVRFHNPVTGGFVTEAGHLTDTSAFLAPMDQTHTLSAGATYRHAESGVWAGATLEYGSGTPMGHGGSHDHGDDAGDHGHGGSSGEAMDRVRAHTTGNLSVGVDLLRDGRRRPRLTIRLDVENVSDRVYRIAQEGEFSPAQFSIPRLVSLTGRVRF